MKKDVLIIATHYMNFKISGNNRSNYIPQLLAEAGYSVEKICSNFNHHTKEHIHHVEEKLMYKLTLIETIGYKKNVSLQRVLSQKLFAMRLAKYLNKINKPDVIYCFVPSIDVANVARKYASKNNIKLIIDVRDLWPEAFKMVFKVPIINDIFFYPQTYLANKVYNSADEIIAVSDSYKRRAMKVNKKVKIGHTIYIGTELKMFDKYANKNPEIKKTDNEIILAYVGTLGHSYDLKTVFDAMGILEYQGYKNLKLLVMGSGPLESKYREYAQQKGINVEFTGRLPYPKMVEKLVAGDIAINSITKGAAQSIINKHADYAASGLPVINTQESQEYRKLVEEYKIGLNCINSDPIDMAKKIEILVNDVDKRIAMGQNHRKLAEERFDRDKTYQKILELL